MERVILIRHNDGPEDDRVATWLRARGIEPETRRPFLGEPLGPVDGSVAATVVYGGPFNVFEEDRHPFLAEEHRWIGQCIEAQVPVLGICQGAQSVARVLGAAVGPTDPPFHEFGYYPVEPTEVGRALLPEPLHLAQSHFHCFDLPDGAERLARSAAYPNQAFRYGEGCYGFQFHAEVTPAGFRRWQEADWAPFGRPGAQTPEEQDRLMAVHDAAQDRWFNGFLAMFFAPVVAASAA